MISAGRGKSPESIVNELQRNLIGDGFGAPPAHILEAVDDAMAHRRHPGVPHSIYEEVWHMAFYQELTLDWIAGKPTPYPEHATEGFPAAVAEPWDQVRQRFLNGAEHAARIAGMRRSSRLWSCANRGRRTRRGP
jgi:hypothetical protein